MLHRTSFNMPESQKISKQWGKQIPSGIRRLLKISLTAIKSDLNVLKEAEKQR